MSLYSTRQLRSFQDPRGYAPALTQAIVVPAVLGAPEFVFAGVPAAAIRRYVDGVEHQVTTTNGFLANGLRYQAGSTTKQPIL